MDAKGYKILVEPPAMGIDVWRVTDAEVDIPVEMCSSKEAAIERAERSGKPWIQVNDYVERNRLDSRWYREDPERDEVHGPYSTLEDAVQASLNAGRVAMVFPGEGTNRLEVPPARTARPV